MTVITVLFVFILLWVIVNSLAYIIAAVFCHVFDKNNVFQKWTGECKTSQSNSNVKVSDGFKQNLRSYVQGYINYMLYRTSIIPSFQIRNFLYRKVFKVKATHRTVFYSKIEIRSPWNVKIGDSVIGSESKLDGRFGVTIGNHVTLSNNTCIWTDEHDVNDPWFRGNDKSGPVTIGDYAWLSSRSTILPKIHVGEGTVLASGAIATSDLKPYKIYVGVPAKDKGERLKTLYYDNCYKRHIW